MESSFPAVFFRRPGARALATVALLGFFALTHPTQGADTGSEGETGSTGSGGETGSTSSTGSGGETGSTGSTGETGSTGSTGETVSSGSSGAVGSLVVGNSSVANASAPMISTFFSYTTGASAGTVLVVPFAFNGTGNYSLVSVSLLLRGNASLSGLSLTASSTLPTTSAAPTTTTLATFSTSGTLTSTPTAYNFTANAASDLDFGTTYYLRLAYTGPDDVNWIRTDTTDTLINNSNMFPVISTHPDGTLFYFRSITDESFTDYYGAIGGFSITANAVSAVPEPGAVAALAGGTALLAGFFVRWRRSRAIAPLAPEAPSQG